MEAYTVPAWVGSKATFEIPPRKKSLPFGEPGSTRSVASVRLFFHVWPPSVVSYTPTLGDPGGVNLPPLTEDEPCRATAVPTYMCLACSGSTATLDTPRFSVKSFDLKKVGTFANFLPPSVDAYKPTPASLS